MMFYSDLARKISRVKNANIELALSNIVADCQDQGMGADDTYKYIINALTEMK